MVRSNVLTVTVEEEWREVTERIRVRRLHVSGPTRVKVGTTATYTVEVEFEKPLPQSVKYCGGVYVNGRNVAGYCIEVPAGSSRGRAAFKLYWGQAGTYQLWCEGPDDVAVKKRVPIPILKPIRPLPYPVIL